MAITLLYVDFEIPYLLKDADYPVGGTAVEWNNWINGFLEIGVDIKLLTWKGATQFINSEQRFEIVEAYTRSKGIPKLRS